MDKEKLKANIWKMYLFAFLSSMHFMSAVLIPFFTEWGKISYQQIMILQTSYVVASFIFEIPTGAIADLFGRRISVLLGVIINVLGVLVYVYKPDFVWFLVGELMWAFADSLVSGANSALVYDSLKMLGREKESKKVLARYDAIKILGMIISAPIGSVIAWSLGLRCVWLLVSIPFGLAALVIYTVKEPTSFDANIEKNIFNIMSSGIKHLYHCKELRIITIDGVLITALVFTSVWTYQLVLMRDKLSIVYFGLIHGVGCIFQFVLLNNFSVVEKWLGSKKRYLTISAFVSGASFILLGLTIGHLALNIILIWILFSVGIARFTAVKNYLHKHIESHNRATVLSTVFMLRSLIAAMIYLVLGAMIKWSLSGTMIVIGIIIVLITAFTKIEESYLVD